LDRIPGPARDLTPFAKLDFPLVIKRGIYASHY